MEGDLLFIARSEEEGREVKPDQEQPGAEYGSSDSDVRHRLTVTATYNVPGKKGYGQLLEGWKLNAIVSLQTGLPWLVDDLSNDFSGSQDFGDRWNFYGDPNDFKSSSSSLPFCTGPKNCSVTSGVSGIQGKVALRHNDCVASSA